MMQPTDCLCHQYLLVMITQTFDLKEVQFLFCPNVASITTPVPPPAVSVENSVHFNSLYFTSLQFIHFIQFIVSGAKTQQQSPQDTILQSKCPEMIKIKSEATVGWKNSLLAGRKLQQSQAQGGASIC